MSTSVLPQSAHDPLLHQAYALRRNLVPEGLRQSAELFLVEEFYSQKRARRSGVPLLFHIYEGLAILHAIGASEAAQRAYCLHPVLQADAGLGANLDWVASSLDGLPDAPRVMALTLEYRFSANSYLSHMPLPSCGAPLSRLAAVNQMLLADKVQNNRDFLFYHQGWHPRSEHLTEYFQDWLRALLPGDTEAQVQRLCAALPPQHRWWRNPLPLALTPSGDGLSFQGMPRDTTALPLTPHPGAFGVQRRHHVHEGVDLYCPENTPVCTVEPGRVVEVLPFTGPTAGLPWWQDTDVVLVEGPSGVVAYGEVAPAVQKGQVLQTGDIVGHVKQVLTKDKGRPMSMLHLELHAAGARACPEWPLGAPRPVTLQDPTGHLLRAYND